MRIRQDKIIIALSIIFFLATQALIFASIPNNIDNQRLNIVVKSGTGLNSISEMLNKQGIINSRYLFLLCSMLYGGKLIAGEYELTRDMSTIGIVRKMGNGERKVYVLKIVEGYNIYNIAKALEKADIMKAEEFLSTAKNPAFLSSLGISADSLEGYLAPETYFYSREVDVQRLLGKIAKRTINIFSDEGIKRRMKELNLDIHKILTIASMIEKEARYKDEKPVISAVFHNRLKKGMSLDCDPTVIYGTGRFDSPITKTDLLAYTPYNTYRFKGLPKGPICSPDYTSIMAALYPAKVNYIYFVSKNDGTHVFSEDMRDHNRFVSMYQRVKKQKNHL